MCEWCGAGFSSADPGSSGPFCSASCRRKSRVFRLEQSLSQVRQVQYAHIFNNWRALPADKRLDWIKGAVSTVAEKVRTGAVSQKSRQTKDTSALPSRSVLAASQEATASTGNSSSFELRRGRGIVDLVSDLGVQTPTVTHCVLAETVPEEVANPAAWGFDVPGATTAIVKMALPKGDAVSLSGMTGVGMSLFVPDPALVADFGVWVFSANGGRFRWSARNTADKLQEGWNYPRFGKNWMRSALERPQWGEISAVQIYVRTTAPTSFALGQIWAETRPKASLLFIHDGGYADFDRSPGYQDLRDRGIPVTWSVDCALIGDSEHVSRDRLIEVGNENGNSISFHGWNSARSQDYVDGAEAREETAKCQEWIADLPCAGNSGRAWRTAWMQNRSPFSPATNDMVKLNPMWDPTNRPPAGVALWPLTHPYNYWRGALHHLSPRALAELFEEAKQTHGVLICYTHNVEDGEKHISPELWQQFLDLIDQGLDQGWLEGSTFETLTSEERGA